MNDINLYSSWLKYVIFSQIFLFLNQELKSKIKSFSLQELQLAICLLINAAYYVIFLLSFHSPDIASVEFQSHSGDPKINDIVSSFEVLIIIIMFNVELSDK